MKHPRTRKKIAMGVTAAVLAALLLLPASMSAKEKRGARLVVTRMDGLWIEGELIAVRQDSLLLLGWAGRNETVALADVRTVRIARKNHAGTLALGGLAAGAAGGAIYARSVRDEHGPFEILAAGFYGIIGALSGLALSVPVGLDTTFAVAGEPEAVVRSRLDNLARLSRESRNRRYPGLVVAGPDTEPVTKPEAPAVPSPGPSRPPRRPRFRLAISETLSPKLRYSSLPSEQHSFRFPGDVPPAEAGPHPVTFDGSTRAGMYRMVVFGPVSLAYEWTEHLSSEIEVFLTKPGHVQTITGTLRFTSTADGKTYSEWLYNPYYADFDSLLFGLTYRPLAPTAFDRHIFEAGLAVGPAWVKSMWSGFFPADRKTVLSARVQAAYDFYFIPALSLGASVGYRHLEAKFPATAISGEMVFHEDGAPYYPASITRLTELTIPGRSYTRSSFFLALRAGFRI